MTRYRHLFFDLDHTLWDFRSNSRETLSELHAQHRLAGRGVTDAMTFIDVFEEVNTALWAELRDGRMPKEVLRVLRFRTALQRFGVVDGRLASRLSADYLTQCPLKPRLMPGAMELLNHVKGRYRLHIITNGFEDVQRVKLLNSGIHLCFDVVLSSERAGAAKPDARIFAAALRQSGATLSESLMIGDSAEADMAGARAAGIDHVHYHAETKPDPLATYRVAHLDELRGLLV